MRTAIISSHHPDWRKLADMTDETKRDYCDRWPDHTFISDESNKLLASGSGIRGFIKFDLILQYFEQFDRIVWMDADCFITNPELPIPESDHPILTGYDFNGIHTTVIILKTTPTVREFFYACNNSGRVLFQSHPWHEMEAMRYFSQTPPYDDLIEFQSSKKLCPILRGAYPDFIAERIADQYYWKKGDWTLHLCNLPLPSRELIAGIYPALAL